MPVVPPCLTSKLLLPGLLGLACLGASLPAQAQTNSTAEREKVSDGERARRDADKVFNFIKFHTVKPAAKEPAAAAPRPAAPRPSAAAVPAAAVAAAATAPPTATVMPVPGQRGVAETAPAPLPTAAAPAAVAEPSAPAERAPASSPPQPAVPVAEPVQAVPAPPSAEPEEVAEVPLKLVAYSAPQLNSQVLAAVPSSGVVVPVRFVVQPNGVVSDVSVRGTVPRQLARAATAAVQQWRFEPIPARREVDVELAFKAE